MKDTTIKFYAGTEDRVAEHSKEQGAVYLVTNTLTPSLCMDIGDVRYKIQDTTPKVNQINKEVEKLKSESYLEASNLEIDGILKTILGD